MYSVFLQYAHHDSSRSDNLGSMDLEKILQTFDSFNWSEQVHLANRLKKCSPTLSIEDKGAQRLIWVSACGTEDNFEFTSECQLLEKKDFFFGIFKGNGRVNLFRSNLSLAQARKALGLFVSNNDEKLKNLYKET